MVRTVGFLSDIVSSQAILDCVFYVLINIKKKKKKKSFTSSDIKAFFMVLESIFLLVSFV